MSVPAAAENGPCFKKKPWIPPPARTTKDAPRESNRATSTGPRPMVQIEKLAGAVAAPSPDGISTCTDTEAAHPKRQEQQGGAASPAVPRQLDAGKLSQVVRQLEAGCDDLAFEVQRHEEATASARHTLEHAQRHVQALRAMQAVAREHQEDPENQSVHLKDKVAELKSMLEALRERSGSISKHLNLCLKEKEALVAGLEKELGYQEVCVEHEQMRHKRCLDALEIAHRQHRDVKNILRGRLRSMELKLEKFRKALDHTALLLNQREKELAQARRYQLGALAAGGHLQDMVQRKLVAELEPVGRAGADDRTTEKDWCKRCCGDRAGSLLKQDPTQSRNHQFNRMQVDGEGRNIRAGGIHPRNAGDGPDKEKEKLRRQVAELQERLNRVEASNRNLTSYIASLRQSYAAVFKDTPASSIRPEDEDASLIEDC